MNNYSYILNNKFGDDKIKKFYEGYPKNSPYLKKLKQINTIVSNYLLNFPIYKKFSVIFDIDDTLIYTDPADILNKNLDKNINGRLTYPGIKEIIDILKLCNKLKLEIIIITARPYTTEEASIQNLKLLGIKYDKMYHNDNYPDINFKIALKKKLSKKHNFILSMGDQWPDLQGLKDCLCIKLPDPRDINTYVTFDNKKIILIE